ncbi:MAG TPA: TonB-dependent receptor [Ignavibacteriaceae bacterium]|nr:TonB-dependent receptor [Ignavibacteriaceae bacterium]
MKLIGFFFFCAVQIFAQSNISVLKGVVINGESHEPIPHSVVRILDTDIYSTSNSMGYFELKNGFPNSFFIEVSSLGYKKEKIKIDSSNIRNHLMVHLYPLPLEMPAVVVTGTHTHSKFDELHELANVLKGKDLQRDLGLSLASTLKNETGLAIRSMGPAPARPVIRGLGGDRIIISEDGTKNNDLSATSPDHAVTIEPFTIDRVEVIRGPKILKSGTSTFGGVVNIVREDIPQNQFESISGTAGIFGETANNGFLAAAIVKAPISFLNFRVELSKRKADNLTTPLKELNNSNIEALNYSTGLSYVNNKLRIGLSLREFELDYGVPGGFVGAHPFGVNISMFKRSIHTEFNYNLKNNIISQLNLKINRTFYRHIEYEFGNRIGAEFGIRNLEAALEVETDHLFLFEEGSFGLSFENKDFNIGGFVFTPPTIMNNLSSFFHQTIQGERLSVEIGGRISHSVFTPRRVTQSAKEEYIKKRSFLTYSAAISLLLEFGKSSSIGINISRSSRIPTIEELYSEGPHLAAYSYEVGNPNLETEKGIGTEIFYYYKRPNLFFNMNLFYNHIDSYIIPRNTGKINSASMLPIYQTTSVNARLTGIETQFEYSFLKNFSVALSNSYTKGFLADSNSPLPAIPPYKGLLTIKYSNDFATIGVMFEGTSSQKLVDEFEEPTSGYLIINTFFQYSINMAAHIHSLSLNVDNITNRVYRNHLSRVKSIMPEAKRNFRLTYRFYF